MSLRSLLVGSLWLSTLLPSLARAQLPFRNPDLPVETRVKDLVSRLETKEKAWLIYWLAEPVPRLDIPAYEHGNEALHGVVRPGKATVFPQAIGLGATFNPDLIFRMATAISDEARAKHHHEAPPKEGFARGLLTFWSPVVNMVRDPRWGRTQETYGEDPHLTSRLGVAFVRGLQGNDPRYLKVVSTPKHFAANNEEHNRFECDVRADDRYLHEFEYPGFRAAIVEGKAASIMGAYNAVNGVPACANRALLTDLLRGSWGFDGYVVSDCGAVSHLVDRHKLVKTPEEAAAAALNAGLDLECGWFATYKEVIPRYLEAALTKKLVTAEVVDRALERVLTARFKLGMFDPPERVPFARIPLSVVGGPAHVALAREVARQSMVLLKNAPAPDGKPLLPLEARRLRRIAVVGPNAAIAQFGNYSGTPANPAVTPLDGVRARAGKATAVIAVPWLSPPTPVPAEALRAGLTVELFGNAELAGKPANKRVERELALPSPATAPFSARWTGSLSPSRSGTHAFRFEGEGGFRVWVDDRLVHDQWSERRREGVEATVALEEGRPHRLKIEYRSTAAAPAARFEWRMPAGDEAERAAREAEVVIAVMGLGTHVEDEGKDRETIDFPADQEEFVRRMLAANPRTIVVLESGSPLASGWLKDHAPALLQAWYPGEQGGHAIADVLFGDVSPAGRLPLTFYTGVSQLRPFGEYDLTKGRTYMYLRGEPLFPFGHGLSYAQFIYSAVDVKPRQVTEADTLAVSLSLRNTGRRASDEVVQVYVRALTSAEPRPLRQLKAFQRVHLKAGRSRRLTLRIPVRDLAFWDAQRGAFVVEPGGYEVMVGASSADIRASAPIDVR